MFFRCILYMALIGIASFLLGRIMPASWFHENEFPYRSYKWEKSGSVYKALNIQKWQKKLPDMSRILPGVMQEKKIGAHFEKDLPLMIKETCIAEFIHVLLCVAILYCLHLWPGFGGKLFCFIYILVNIPFILIQRYNRPRLMRLQERVTRQAEKKSRKEELECQS